MKQIITLLTKAFAEMLTVSSLVWASLVSVEIAHDWMNGHAGQSSSVPKFNVVFAPNLSRLLFNFSKM